MLVDDGDRFTYRYPFSLFNLLDYCLCPCRKCKRINDGIEKIQRNGQHAGPKPKRAKRRKGMSMAA